MCSSKVKTMLSLSQTYFQISKNIERAGLGICDSAPANSLLSSPPSINKFKGVNPKTKKKKEKRYLFIQT